MAETVAILGGGIGGLTAAHELVERGFTVRVYERKPIFGGKARSIPVPGSATAGRKALPGEHGFRFFPCFYRHVPDTMARIPFGTNRRGVLDNLVPTNRTILARAGQPDLALLARFPRDREEWRFAFAGLRTFLRLIPPTEMLHYLWRWLVWLTSCHERRLSEYEQVPWWEFTRAAGRSPAYQQFLGHGLTRMLVAIRAEESSARTTGAIGFQLFQGLLTRGMDVDCVLCGPTNEMWIDPWVRHLERLGAACHREATVRQIHSDGHRVTHVTVERAGRAAEVTADYYVAALPVEVMTALLTPELARAAPSLANIGRLRTAWMNGMQFYLAQDVPITRGHAVYVDSPWALTSVSQHQFWEGVDLTEYGDGQVRGILSVDISDWEAPGLLYGRPARECTAEEIKNEVWAQLMAHLDPPVQQALAQATVLHWFLDPDIEFPNPSGVVNVEPLLINTVGSLADRPEARTEIENLFLAADYVRTHTDLASMEAANEAARRAVNALLRAAGNPAPRATVWPLSEPAIFRRPQAWDRWLFTAGQPHSLGRAFGAALGRRIAGGWRGRGRTGPAIPGGPAKPDAA
jgi:15-cis-phytoene desaturase